MLWLLYTPAKDNYYMARYCANARGNLERDEKKNSSPTLH